jgi:hypothetical protein
MNTKSIYKTISRERSKDSGRTILGVTWWQHFYSRRRLSIPGQQPQASMNISAVKAPIASNWVMLARRYAAAQNQAAFQTCWRLT